MAQASRTAIALVVTAYFIVSIALVFSNKILVTKGTSIPAPLFVTWFQCALTVIIIWVLGKLNHSQGDTYQSLKEFPVQSFDWNVARKVLPLSIIFVGMITFNNLCILYVEVSFYNVARSLTIVFNVIFSLILLGEKTSFHVMVCLGIVIFGFFAGADGEINFSLLGTVFGVTSSIFVSLNSIYTKKVMAFVQDDKWRLAYYNNINASIMFLPLIYFTGEIEIIKANSALLYSSGYWSIMMLSGLLGFLIGIVTVMQINYTSPLTHNISGTAKACVQTILAIMLWKNPWTWKGMFGVFMVIFGSMAYAYVKMIENDKPKQPAYQPVMQRTDSDVEIDDVEMAAKPTTVK